MGKASRAKKNRWVSVGAAANSAKKNIKTKSMTSTRKEVAPALKRRVLKTVTPPISAAIMNDDLDEAKVWTMFLEMNGLSLLDVECVVQLVSGDVVDTDLVTGAMMAGSRNVTLWFLAKLVADKEMDLLRNVMTFAMNGLEEPNLDKKRVDLFAECFRYYMRLGNPVSWSDEGVEESLSFMGPKVKCEFLNLLGELKAEADQKALQADIPVAGQNGADISGLGVARKRTALRM